MNTGRIFFFPDRLLFPESVISKESLDNKGLFNQLLKDYCSYLHLKDLATASPGNKQ